MNSAIRAERLVKRYKNQVALQDVSLDVPMGRIVGLIGPNGAGKTTLIKSILGLTDVEGDLAVLGRAPRRDRTALMHEVSYIADVAVLPRWLRAGEAAAFMAGVHPRFSMERFRALLERTSVRESMRVRELSKGMAAQLHLALAMAVDARLLVLDEPTLGLDILYRKAFYEALLNDYATPDRTILLATHQVEEVENLLSDLVFIKSGKVILSSSMDEVAERYHEVLVGPGQRDAARSLGPLRERSVFGKSVFLFDGVPSSELASLGEVRRPGVADLFVALMGDAA